MKTLQMLRLLLLLLLDLLLSTPGSSWLKLQPNPLSIKQMPATFVLDMQQNPRSSRLETQHSNGWPQFIGIKRFDVKIVVVVPALIAREAVTVTVTVTVAVAVTVTVTG